MVRSISVLLAVLCAVLVSFGLQCDGARTHSLKPVARRGVVHCTLEPNGCYKSCSLVCPQPAPGSSDVPNCFTSCAPGCYKKYCMELAENQCMETCTSTSGKCWKKCLNCCGSKVPCLLNSCEEACNARGCINLAPAPLQNAQGIDYISSVSAKIGCALINETCNSLLLTIFLFSTRRTTAP